nr:MAG TPA_asm: hypothetical protein [Bacteriophage sp.]
MIHWGGKASEGGRNCEAQVSASDVFPRVTLYKMYRPPQARLRYLPHAAAHKFP